MRECIGRTCELRDAFGHCNVTGMATRKGAKCELEEHIRAEEEELDYKKGVFKSNFGGEKR